MPDDVQVPDSIEVGGGDGSAPPQDSNQAQQQQQQVRLELDDSQVDASYANLCFVSRTAEE